MKKKLFPALLALAAAAACLPASASAAEIVVTEGPQGGELYNKSTVALKWELVGGSLGMTVCYLDEINFNCYPSGVMVLTDGPHTLQIINYDMFGPSGTTTRDIQFSVDTVAPAFAVAEGPPQGATVHKGKTAFKFATDGTAATVQCSLDGTAATDCANGLNINPLKPGLHVLSATATDVAGNSSTLTRFFVGSNLAGTTKKRVKFCYRVKKTRDGKVVKRKNGKPRYRKVCRRVTITY